MSIQLFIEDRDPNRVCWLTEYPYMMYVRKTKHFIDGEAVPCVDILSITNTPVKRGGGEFWRLLDRMKVWAAGAGFEYICVGPITASKRLVNSLVMRNIPRAYFHSEYGPTFYIKVGS